MSNWMDKTNEEVYANDEARQCAYWRFVRCFWKRHDPQGGERPLEYKDWLKATYRDTITKYS